MGVLPPSCDETGECTRPSRKGLSQPHPAKNDTILQLRTLATADPPAALVQPSPLALAPPIRNGYTTSFISRPPASASASAAADAYLSGTLKSRGFFLARYDTARTKKVHRHRRSRSHRPCRRPARSKSSRKIQSRQGSPALASDAGGSICLKSANEKWDQGRPARNRRPGTRSPHGTSASQRGASTAQCYRRSTPKSQAGVASFCTSISCSSSSAWLRVLGRYCIFVMPSRSSGELSLLHICFLYFFV